MLAYLPAGVTDAEISGPPEAEAPPFHQYLEDSPKAPILAKLVEQWGDELIAELLCGDFDHGQWCRRLEDEYERMYADPFTREG